MCTTLARFTMPVNTDMSRTDGLHLQVVLSSAQRLAWVS